MQRAADLLRDLAQGGVTPKRLTNDSRKVYPGDVFLAYPGAAADGRNYIDAAIGKGAAAVLVEAEGWLGAPSAFPPVLPVEGLRELAGDLAAALYEHPSHRMRLIGVTGTNGKTSTTHWVASALQSAGERCAVVGTLGNGLIGALEETLNTTPDALTLHADLARFHAAGAQACAMEVSSIGLAQGRVNGARFDTAVFTNLTRDHLDFHGTMEAYADAKRQLFLWPGLHTAVINMDDPFGRELANSTRADTCIGYSVEGDVEFCARRLIARDVAYTASGVRFELQVDDQTLPVVSPVIGAYNVSNLLATAGVLLAAGQPVDALPDLLGGLTPPPGRMQRYGGDYTPLVAVDYAHTPDALENALRALQPLAAARGGKLVCVFGCGGDRDRGKRPQMAQIACRLADRVWLTSDNPRSEQPEAILADVAAGAQDNARQEVDRKRAIQLAVAEASAADVLLVAGKGHENYQEIMGRKFPYSDALEVNAALAAWRGAGCS